MIEGLSSLVVATGNSGKYSELSALLKPIGIDPIFGRDFNLPEVEETGHTFVENAIIKGRYMADMTGMAALSDDSGFCVDDLDGAPGVYSARWAKCESGKTDFLMAMKKVIKALEDLSVPVSGRAAWFECVLCLALPDGSERTWHGRCDGHLQWPPRGDAGFGYDPMFVPHDQAPGESRTFAEMSPSEKHSMVNEFPGGLSHRARAFYAMMSELKSSRGLA